MTTKSNAASKATGYIAAIGAAGGVGAFLLLIFPEHASWAVLAAIVVLLFALGAVSWLGGPTEP